MSDLIDKSHGMCLSSAGVTIHENEPVIIDFTILNAFGYLINQITASDLEHSV